MYKRQIAFGAADIDILSVGEGMRERGWVSSRTQGPDGIHLMLSPGHVPIADAYVADLTELVTAARAGRLHNQRPAEVRYGG